MFLSVRQNKFWFFSLRSIFTTIIFVLIFSNVDIKFANAVGWVGIPSDFYSAGAVMPYGGQSILGMFCPCSKGNIFLMHDYRTRMMFPVFQDFAETIYHTKQNLPALLSPGNYQLGNLEGETECIVGVPPYCLDFLSIPAFKIKNFGNGGIVAAGGNPINPLAWVALGTAAAIYGWSLIYADGDDGTAEGSPGCNAKLTKVWFCGKEHGPMVAHFETPGRTSWPQKQDGGGPIEYLYTWSGAISGEGQTRTVNFPTQGLKNVKVKVKDSSKAELSRDCPPVIVAKQSPTVNPSSSDLNVSCTVSKTVVNTGDRVTFSLEVFGGSGGSEYRWYGDVTSATTTYATSSSSWYNENYIDKSFTSAGTKIVSVMVSDSNGNTALRYCAPVVVKNEAETLMCGRNYLNLTCTVDKRSVNPGETITYSANGAGGTPEPAIMLNGLIYLNGKKVDWLKVCQNSKNLVNMFTYYGDWNSSNLPHAGDMVEVSIRSIDGRYELKGEAEWPESGCGPEGGQTYDSCAGSGAPTDGGLSCPGATPTIPPVNPVECPDYSGSAPATAGLEPITSSTNLVSFAEKNGVVSMEAEHYKSQTGYSLYSNSEASGGKIMQVGAGGSLNFEFNITNPGTWYLWIRTHVTDSNNNGMYIKLNGSDLRHSSGINDIYLSKNGWSWMPEWLFGESDHNGPISFRLNSGKNTISITKRKIEQPIIDKIVLTRTNNPPTGFGPAETTASSAGTTPITDPISNPGATDFAAVTGHRASFLFDDADTRVMNILSPRLSNSRFEQILSRTKGNGDNAIYLFLINQGDGPYTPHTFYKDDRIGGQIDSAKLSIYKQRLDAIKSLGYKVIFWIRADDSRTMMQESIQNYKKYHQDIVDNFSSYADGYVIGLESNEYMDASTEKTLIADMKSRTNKTVGVHYGSSDSYNSRAKNSGADIYYRQYGWVSCSKVVSVTATTISAVSPMKVVAAEYDKDSDSGCGAGALQAGAIGYGNG